ncbi:kinesin-like protein KIF11 [Haplochromis burtoni]|uniref:kinesin-like protein KIF11 n=1 Tax=Haplochromis burtoni TaxID=8153 RepID=UPI001C2CD209|nr:kinesin-like protein KIF11 [Haplochromis burtoni]
MKREVLQSPTGAAMRTSNSADPLAGIIPRTLHQIFEKLSENGTEFSVKVSLLEIYNEELFDLLSPTEDVSERLQLFDDPRNKRGVVVKGLEEVTVHNKDEVYQILERGAAKRRTASTLTRSHVFKHPERGETGGEGQEHPGGGQMQVFGPSAKQIEVYRSVVCPILDEVIMGYNCTVFAYGQTGTGKTFTMEGERSPDEQFTWEEVDLAGSENIGRSGAVDKRAREAGNINQSLLTLGRVITALVEKRPHVPYRESKLTRILQDSLGGRTKTSIIATVSPSSSNLEETLSTLEYASRAKNIMNKPEVNQKLTKRTLIKEYTEEIERLKRDLAATRDKHGVYLSSENYESMVAQITAHEEQVTEYNDKIAIMEEELKKVTELFADSKARLEQCTADLDEKQQRLEETSRDLRETKVKLSEEAFICSELSSAQETLYDTAGQLLSTADASTSDVSGLHDKLNRKKKVEEHNREMQQSFAQRMDGSFRDVQRCIQQHGDKQRHMLSSYSQAVDGLLVMNEAALKGALTTVESFVGGVRPLVAESVARCEEKVQQNETLCLQDKESVLQLLEEHRRDMEEVLVVQTLMGLSAAKELNDSLRASMEKQRALADKAEAMKEMGVVFDSLVRELAAMREAAVQSLSALQAERDELEDKIRQAEEEIEQKDMKETIQCLQDQLNLLTVKVKKKFTGLYSASRGLQKPLQSLQEDISRGCSTVEHQVSAQADLLSSSASSLVSSLCLTVDESRQSLEEMSGCCSHIHSSVTGLLERDLEWSSRVKEHAEKRAEEHLTLMRKVGSEAQDLRQSVEDCCSEQLRAAKADISNQQQEVTRALTTVKDQTSVDWSVLEEQRAELLQHVEASEQLVHSFLRDELQEDVPTGATPQRREFVYPRQLVKSRRRSELLESLRRQQEELQAAMEAEEEEELEEEDKQTDPDSLEDDLSTCNESLATEPSFIDENLVFNESKRVPFFKKKKGKKETKFPSRSKVSENEAESTPQKSRLPLRCQN